MKLNEFRLDTYDERSVLQYALELLRAYRPDNHPEIVNTLLVRLSRTQCQPGGCEYCRD
jgi:hypothetical protein